MRRISREYVFKLVFEYTFYGETHDETMDLFLSDADLTDEDKDYVKACYFGVTETSTHSKRRLRRNSNVTPWTGFTVPTLSYC